MYALTSYQYNTLESLANGTQVTLTSFGHDEELDDLIVLAFLADVSPAFSNTLSQFRTKGGDSGRVLMLTQTGLQMFLDIEWEHIN